MFHNLKFTLRRVGNKSQCIKKQFFTDLLSNLQEAKDKLQLSLDESEVLKQTNASLHLECSNLQESIKKYQSKVEAMKVLDNELESLREQLFCKEKALEDAMINHDVALNDLKQNFEKEKKELLTRLSTEFAEELAKVNSELNEEKEAKGKLLSQLETSEMERKNEISRINWEYEAKLTEIQRQKVQMVQQQHDGFSKDLIRTKMQHMKESYEQELALLKNNIVTLQTQLDNLQQASHVQHKVTSSNLLLQEYPPVKSPMSENRKVFLQNKRRIKKL
ncbi:coiled-coil domain-containing protein 152-like isoform X4 [Biomphalaria glabrata]|uniref:Coiled-coil domain-containing protein 152-like isoform X4 n=1 Tax=Biomphalaria glabrata TaxID=6526 RepID=A0A9W3AIT5_BIOGL|nr:coiled-coil domain-containing protein 152-like isoform X4 [Biomphalaria glabrata]